LYALIWLIERDDETTRFGAGSTLAERDRLAEFLAYLVLILPLLLAQSWPLPSTTVGKPLRV
jgi:hypothetical protein